MRNTRAGDARDRGLAHGHEREVSRARPPGPAPARRRTSRDLGPTTAIVAHCSVTDVAWTRSSGHSVWSHSSSHSSTRRRVAGGRGHVPAVVAEAAGDTVVEDHAVGMAHQPVAARTDLQVREAVRVDAVEEHADVRPLEVDLAEGRGVHHGHGTASRRSLAQDGLVHRLTVAREVARPLPLADVLEHCPVVDVPGVDRAWSGQGREGRRDHGRRAARTTPAHTAGGTSGRRGRRAPGRGARQRRRWPAPRRSCPGRCPCRSSCTA